VEVFYDFLVEDELMKPFFANLDMVKQRRMLKSFLNHVLGGRPYNGRSMAQAHAKLGLKDVHFDKVLHYLKAGMQKLGVAEEHSVQIIGIAETTRKDVLGKANECKGKCCVIE
jgi:hemoglobin